MVEQKSDSCCCRALPDLAAVPMGGDGLDERVFATVEVVQNHGGDKWWLYLARCGACSQNWMVAQEERIFDAYFMRRVSDSEVRGIGDGQWPDDFTTYERVLKIGQATSKPFTFVDPLAASLIWTVEDLRKARPEITVEEISRLLGVTRYNTALLLQAANQSD